MSEFSILQREKQSYKSTRTDQLEKHHIFFGPLRKSSDKYGCWIWLTSEEHRGNDGPHQCRETDLKYKRECQEEFEAFYGHEKFMEVFGRNYLDGDEDDRTV